MKAGMTVENKSNLKQTYQSETVRIPIQTDENKKTTSDTKAVIKFDSTRFGNLEITEDRVINFPGGVLGFPDARRFVMIDHEGDIPFKWLQSVDEPELAFITINPLLIKEDYKLSINKSDIADIGKYEAESLAFLVILTIPNDNPKGTTANLRGPLVINSDTKTAKQIVLQDDTYPVKYPLYDDQKNDS